MNELTERQRERILERLRRGDSLRRIEAETGHRRETIARVARRAASEALARETPSRCEPYRTFVQDELSRGASARTIHRQLVDAFGYDGAYSSVKRYVRRLRSHGVVRSTVTSLAFGRPASPTAAPRFRLPIAA